MNEERIYLDYNASTPIAAEVAEAMAPFLTDHHGNPSSGHWASSAASAALSKARGQVASLLGADPSGVTFTSGGTESNNWAIKGVVLRRLREAPGSRPHVVISAFEHPSVIEPCRYLETLGARFTEVPVDRQGMVDPDLVRRAIEPSTVLVSVMHANNEVGTLQPIRAIADVARSAGVLCHTDAAQSLGKVDVRVEHLAVDMLTVAGHKLYAPKGVGALYLRAGVAIDPILHGAGHEGGRRAGTENVLLAVGLGAACELAARHPCDDRLRELRDMFRAHLHDAFGDRVVDNGHVERRLPNTLNVSFVGSTGADLLAKLEGVAASTGSACHAGARSMSPVLRAMGVPEEVGLGAVRFSLGRGSSREELERVVALLGQVL